MQGCSTIHVKILRNRAFYSFATIFFNHFEKFLFIKFVDILYNMGSNNIKHTLEYIKNLAAEQGCECLSDTYCNMDTKMSWRCINHNIVWNGPAAYFTAGKTGCKQCSGEKTRTALKTKIEDIILFAEKRDGKLLSTEYKNNTVKLTWLCKFNHKFKMQWAVVKNGSWCPECSQSLSERVCREFFEKMFNRSFPKYRTGWLGRQELDGYCPDIGLAFEHNGEQHYRVIKRFNMTEDNLAYNKKQDIIKSDLCKQNGVTLIIIPQIFKLTKIKNLGSLIKQQCEQNCFYNFPEDIETREIILLDAYKKEVLNERLQVLICAAEKLGYKVLGKYLTMKSNLEFYCERHNTFFITTPSEIIYRAGSTCNDCTFERHSKAKTKITIEMCKEIIEKRGGKCLSDKYIPSDYLEVKCLTCTCVWKTTYKRLMNGSWCPECAMKSRIDKNKKRGAQIRLYNQSLATSTS